MPETRPARPRKAGRTMKKPRSSTFWWIALAVLGGVAVLAVVVTVVVRLAVGPERPLARADVVTLSDAVAAHVTEHGTLPRVSVTHHTDVHGNAEWGEEFVVESERLPRADPAQALVYFVVGTPDRWCVEVEYYPTGFLRSFTLDTSSRWAARHGDGGRVGRVVDRPCDEDFLLHLSPVPAAQDPTPDGVVDLVTADAGTCLWGPAVPDAISDSLDVTGQAEAVPCGQPHLGEVYRAGVLRESTYAVGVDASALACQVSFPDFVGVPGNLSAFTYQQVIATEAQWQAGARHFTCVLYLATQAYPLVGSAQDSWR